MPVAEFSFGSFSSLVPPSWAAPSRNRTLRTSHKRWPAMKNLLSSLSGERVGRCRPAAEPGKPGHCPASHAFRIRLRERRDLRGSDPRARVEIFNSPLSLQRCLSVFLCRLERVVSTAQTPSVRRVELGVGCVLSFPLVIREHAVLRRSLCATLTALIDPLAAPSGAIADGFDAMPGVPRRGNVDRLAWAAA